VIQVSEWEAGRFGARVFRSLRENSTHLLLAGIAGLLSGGILLFVFASKSPRGKLPFGLPAVDAVQSGSATMDEVTALAHAVSSITNSLVEKASKIENRDEQRRSFVTGISHDLRTPLSTIKLHVSSLMKASPDLEQSKRDEYYKIISKNVDQVLRMIDQVFNLAKFESLEDSVKMRKFPAFECLHEIVLKFEALSQEKGIEVEGSFEGENLICYGDLDLVYRAICNLVENALKYTPAGGKVTIGVEKKGRRAVFYVQDSGQGIAQEDQAKLFDKFYRVSEGKVVKDGSAGVGLFMVKRIAEVHGGRASVQSVLREGSRFQFDIPIAD